MKRFISSILVVIMLMMTMITAMPVVSNAAIDLNTYNSRVSAFIADSRWSHGKAWDYYARPKYSTYGSMGCCAYCADFVGYVYGSTSRAWNTSDFTRYDNDTGTGVDELRTGDVVYIGTHWIIILSRSGNTLYTAEGNWANGVRIGTGKWVIQGNSLCDTQDKYREYKFNFGYHYNFNDHTHNYNTFVYFGTSHPHYSYYKCSCGEVQISSETNYYSSCDICLGYPSKPSFAVYSGSSTEDTMFLASAVDFASSYDFKVYDPSTDELVYAAYGQHRLCAMNLPAGEYYARAVGINDSLADTDRWWGTYSDAVSFTVAEGTFEPVNSVEYNGHTYELYLNRLSWHNAKLKCEELGGHLATITSEEEQEIVTTLADGKGAYLGATNENGTWEWITGEEFSYTNWVSGEPNNKGHLSENYLGVYSEGGWNDFDYINQNVNGFICEYDACSHESYTATFTIFPTCTEDGEEGRICNDCGEEFLIIDPAIGHNYVSEMIGATCTDTAVKKYTCSNCGDIYSEGVVEEELWSDWDEIYPDGVESEKTEEKTQYRYSTKETTTSAASSLDGWTKYDSKTTYGSWSGNQTTTTKPTASDTLQIVGTSTVYNYHHWCHQSYNGANNNIDSISYGSGGAHHTYTTTYMMSTYNMSDKGGKQPYIDKSCKCPDGWNIWFFDGTTTTYTYQTRSKTVTNYFYKWSDFSDWQDEEVTADDNTKVETRTVYRYLTNSPEALGHDWSEWVLTEATCTEDGSNSRTCNRCGEIEAEVISSLGHDWGEWVTTEATCTKVGSNSRTCNRCGEIESEVIPVLDHTPGEPQLYTEPTCTHEGVEMIWCTVCSGLLSIEHIPMLDHNWSEWIQISAPTATEDGEQLRYCKTCKTSETEVIPATGEEEPEPDEPVDPNAPAVVSVNNYTVTLDKIANIKEIRFAIGHYTKGADIKAAEKNVTLDASTVKKYTDNGIFTYDLPWMGEYTFWVRYNDGSQYFIYTSVDDITPYVESYGVKITVKDYAENYKDMWLTEGTFNSYNEIKASTAFKYQASANKLDLYAKTTHDFSYTMTNPGPYTVLIRYNDGTTDVIHHELTVDYPEFGENGLQVTVTNIPDIKIIRTAYGHYTSVGDIKKASGVRNFSNKTDIKNASEYMIQYRNEGEVTLIVEYNNGYKHFCYLNIEPKTASMIQSKNTVMFDDLDGFVMIRYAKGVYTTSSQIKAAAGSKVLKPAELIGGYAIISGLEKGTYTFCVQFDDESYDYYTVIVE